ncbi:DMT family transporter [bacterium]|nr:DMT family transporter [bacterium]
MGSFSLAKVLSGVVPVPMVMMARFVAGPLYLIPFFILMRKSFSIDRWGVLAARITFGLLAMFCLFNAFRLGDVGKSTLIFECSTLWAFIAAAFVFKERPHKWSIAAVPLAFVGLYFVIQPTNLWEISIGEGYALLGSFFNMGVYLTLKELRRTNDTYSIVIATYAVAAVLTGIPTVAIGIAPTMTQLGLLLVMGSVGLCGQLCFTLGFKYAPAGVSSMMMLVSIPLMYISGTLFFGEVVNLVGMVGILLVVLSLGVISRYQ